MKNARCILLIVLGLLVPLMLSANDLESFNSFGSIPVILATENPTETIIIVSKEEVRNQESVVYHEFILATVPEKMWIHHLDNHLSKAVGGATFYKNRKSVVTSKIPLNKFYFKSLRGGDSGDRG